MWIVFFVGIPAAFICHRALDSTGFRSIIYDHLFASQVFFLCPQSGRVLQLQFSPSLSYSFGWNWYLYRHWMWSQIVYTIKKLRALPLNDSCHWLCIQIIFICYFQCMFSVRLYGQWIICMLLSFQTMCYDKYAFNSWEIGFVIIFV